MAVGDQAVPCLNEAAWQPVDVTVQVPALFCAGELSSGEQGSDGEEPGPVPASQMTPSVAKPPVFGMPLADATGGSPLALNAPLSDRVTSYSAEVPSPLCQTSEKLSAGGAKKIGASAVLPSEENPTSSAAPTMQLTPSAAWVWSWGHSANGLPTLGSSCPGLRTPVQVKSPAFGPDNLTSAKFPFGDRAMVIGPQASGLKSCADSWTNGLMFDASALQIVMMTSRPGVQPVPVMVSLSPLRIERFDALTEIVPGVGSAV